MQRAEETKDNLTSKINSGQSALLTDLMEVNLLISEWYKQESAAINLMSRSSDVNLNEKVCIYHHGQHLQFRKRSSILKLQTPQGIVEGHTECAKALESNVSNHLTNPADLDPRAQEILLKEVEISFTDEDNLKLKAIPPKSEIKSVLDSCRPHAAPGTDGLTVYLYQRCLY